MSIDTNIIQISSLEQLDQMFQDNPETIPTANSLAVGTENMTPENVPVDTNISGIHGIPELPTELTEDETPKELVETPEASTENEQPEEPVEETPEEAISDDSVKEILTTTLDFLVKENIWKDFDGREDLEVTPEVWAELAIKQAQNTAVSMFEEMVDETGAYGKAIISHIKQGGNAEDIIDVFKEQKTLESIDTSTEEGKQIKIESYYSDVLGWRQDRVKRHITRLIENEEVDEEFETVEEAYQKHYEDKLQAVQEKQSAIEKENRDRQVAFVNSIKGALDNNSNLTAKEKQVIASSILDFKHKLSNGQKVNDFYLKFAEAQSDPEDYIELVQFIMNREGYLKKLQKQEETKANKKAFEFIKNNKAVSKQTTTNIPNQVNKQTVTDFSFLTKK